jgi:hypothetical protein
MLKGGQRFDQNRCYLRPNWSTPKEKSRPGVTPDGFLCDCRLTLRFRRDLQRMLRYD